jgi:prepilin-type N-terminal cleavage/methylation domain-containing protein
MKTKMAEQGFTLVEVAMVVLIGGLMMTAASTLFLNYMKQAKIATTQARMQDIENAIADYLSVNSALPCVASMTEPRDSATGKFGRQLTDAVYGYADCITGANGEGIAKGVWSSTTSASPGRTVAVPPAATANGQWAIGAVPTRTLNLPDEEMADAWGTRFLYAVSTAQTVPGAYDVTTGVIYVEDGGANPVAVPAGSALYVLVSHGANRAGGYTLDGKQAVACGAGLEAMNCGHTKSFKKTTLSSDQTGANFFDDYVIFHGITTSGISGIVPSGMIVPFTGGCPAPPQWATYAGAGCTAGGGVVCCKKQ